MRLEGKSALITGASSGLGRHFAELLAGCGAGVVLAARRRDALEEVAENISRRGGVAQVIELDVTDSDAVEAAIGSLPHPVDVLVNNAGVAREGRAIEISYEDWDAVIATNLRGVYSVARAVARRLIAEGRGGAIVNVASVLGLRVASNVSAYAASKAAVIRLTEALALEWARYGIRVNALCPGYIETNLNRDFFGSEAGEALIRRIPMRRLGRLEELDGPLLLLASDLGSFVTGASLVVDGGHVVSSL
jgi:NAD(P)-dependent dehydrogenase (short-subunit alcohol dehydrogenase family)